MPNFFETANLIEETLRIKSEPGESRKPAGTNLQKVEEVCSCLILDRLQGHEALP